MHAGGQRRVAGTGLGQCVGVIGPGERHAFGGQPAQAVVEQAGEALQVVIAELVDHQHDDQPVWRVQHRPRVGFVVRRQPRRKPEPDQDQEHRERSEQGTLLRVDEWARIIAGPGRDGNARHGRHHEHPLKPKVFEVDRVGGNA